MNSTTIMLTHPEVLDVIIGFLVKHGVVRRELDDAVAEVQTRALEAVKDRDPPAEISAWQALCTAVARRWHECVARLDEARAIDPAGDAAPEVLRARAFATQGLEGRPRSFDAKPRP